MTIRSIEAQYAAAAKAQAGTRPVAHQIPAETGGKPATREPTGAVQSRTLTLEIPEITDGKLQLSIDRNTGRVIGRIVDKNSGDLIRQIPSEEILNLIAATEAELGPLYSAEA